MQENPDYYPNKFVPLFDVEFDSDTPIFHEIEGQFFNRRAFGLPTDFEDPYYREGSVPEPLADIVQEPEQPHPFDAILSSAIVNAVYTQVQARKAKENTADVEYEAIRNGAGISVASLLGPEKMADYNEEDAQNRATTERMRRRARGRM